MPRLFKTTFFSALLFLSTVAAQCHDERPHLRCTEDTEALRNQGKVCRITFPVVTVGESSSATLTLENLSHERAKFIDVESAVQDLEEMTGLFGSDADRLNSIIVTTPFHYKGGQFPGEGGTCSNKVEPLQQCTLVFEVTPPAKGFYLQQVPLRASWENSYVITGWVATLFVEAKSDGEEE